MEHITLKAAAAQVTDQGLFEAVISTENIDREKDIVSAAAMVTALKSWNRPIPLSWNHSTKAQDIFGSIEPMTIREEDGEVIAQGHVDLESDVGRDAWRSFKNRTIGFSFGYIAVKHDKRQGGGRHITQLDIFEVTATPTPMNNDTRVLSTKGLEDKAVGPAARGHLENLIEYYRKKAHPFTECVRDNTKRFGKDRAERICARLKDIMLGTTQWRDGGKSVGDEPDWAQLLYDDADGDLEGLLEMWHADMLASGDGDKAVQPSGELKAEYDRLELGLLASGVTLPMTPEPEHPLDSDSTVTFPRDEFIGAKAGVLKAVWSAAYINDLPDSAFLYVETGGDKDSEGKTTPRSLRHFPYKGPDGKVDLPHLRNALARIPQSNLPQDVKDRLVKKAESILADQKAIEDAPHEDPSPDKSDAQDLLRSHDDDRRIYELVTAGIDTKAPRKVEEAPPPPPELPSVQELRREFHDLMLETLIGEDLT